MVLFHLDLMKNGKEYFIYSCFVDCRRFRKEYFNVYLLKKSNNSKDIQNMYVNATETFNKQCLQKRRPRITFNALYKIFCNDFIHVFSDNISNLLQVRAD